MRVNRWNWNSISTKRLCS